MIRHTFFEIGDAVGRVFIFEHRGEGLPMHSHPPSDEHSIRCLAGRVIVWGMRNSHRWEITLEAGGSLLFDSAEPHEIVAVDDGSIIVNDFLHGKPAGYDALPPVELSGIAEVGPVHYQLQERAA